MTVVTVVIMNILDNLWTGMTVVTGRIKTKVVGGMAAVVARG